jgi:hypothetical protein
MFVYAAVKYGPLLVHGPTGAVGGADDIHPGDQSKVWMVVPTRPEKPAM